MFVTALLLGLVGVFCILDSRILGRMNFERPLITCTIVGALLGDLQTGLTLGASIELMSLGIVNIGAAAPPDMNMAAIICAAFAILTDASAETALALAIPIAVLGQMLGVLMRTILSNLTHVADHAIAEGKFRKAWSMHIVWGTLLYSLMYFIPIFLSVYFGTDLVQKIVAFIPAWLTDGLNLGSKFLTAYGIALLLSTMLNRDLTVYFLLGFFFVGYLGLDITAVAIFAAILAVILTGLKYGKGAPAAAVSYTHLAGAHPASHLQGDDPTDQAEGAVGCPAGGYQSLQRQEPCGGDQQGAGQLSVSYTHLEVYKRQGQRQRERYPGAVCPPKISGRTQSTL